MSPSLAVPAPRTRHRLVVAAAGLAAVVTSSLLLAPGAAVASTPLTVFGGYGYATAANLGSYFRTGPTAVTQACTRKAGVLRTNRTAADAIPGVGTVGSVTSSIRTSRTATTSTSRTDTATAATALLGVLHVSGVRTVARVVSTPKGYVQQAWTTVVGGSINGRSLPTSPAVNQTFTVPGLATVVLNRQFKYSGYGSRRMTVIGMQVTIDANNPLHVPAGTVVIGRGVASLHLPTHANATGNAWGTSVSGRSGRTAAVYLPCGGTGGAVLRNRITAATVPQVLGSGLVYTSGYSSDNATRTLARTTSHLTDVSLFGGIVKVHGVNVQAQATRNARGVLSRSASGSSVLGLVVNGKAQSGSAPVNTTFSIPNLGSLVVNRVVKTPNGIQVIGLQLTLSVPKNGLQRGTVVTIGQALAGVAPN